MGESSILFQLENVAWQAGAARILNNICFDLCTGEFKLITDQPGCNKSTLLKIAVPLMSPTGGEIPFEGEEISTLKSETYRRQVSYCTQTPALLSDTVCDDLISPWQIRNKSPGPDVFLVDPVHFELPKTILKKSINESFGGEKQRVLLIRNLQFLPKILLLGGITNALDEASKRNVNELIRHYVRDKNIAVLWMTHSKDEIEHMDNVIVLQPHAGKMQKASSERA